MFVCMCVSMYVYSYVFMDVCVCMCDAVVLYLSTYVGGLTNKAQTITIHVGSSACGNVM